MRWFELRFEETLEVEAEQVEQGSLAIAERTAHSATNRLWSRREFRNRNRIERVSPLFMEGGPKGPAGER
jgi:hypothetical protein